MVLGSSHSPFFNSITKKIYFSFGGVLTRGLDDTTIKEEAQDSINFKESKYKFSLILHHNGSNSFCMLMV